MLILLFIVSGALFLMSSHDLVSIFLSIELQSYGCAPNEVYVAEEPYMCNITHIQILSDMFDPLQTERYLPWVITERYANNTLLWIADYKKVCQGGLPPLEINLNGHGQGQDNELGTYRVAQLGLNILSRISRYLCGNTNAISSRPYADGCRKPNAHFSIEDKNAQGPKTTQKTNIRPLWDPTAYSRRRSFHSSPI